MNRFARLAVLALIAFAMAAQAEDQSYDPSGDQPYDQSYDQSGNGSGDRVGERWDGGQIADIIANVEAILDQVEEIFDQVTGDGTIRVVADEFRSQIDLLSENLFLLQVLEDIFFWFQDQLAPLQDFVGSPRCGSSTPCGVFRSDLITFVHDFAALRQDFPIIDQLGLDGSRAERAIEFAPPILLFGLHQVLDEADFWKQIPADLQSLFDEIDAPEVFSEFLTPFAQNTEAWPDGTRGVFDKTPTQRFCERHETRLDRQIDPVRLNRLQFFVFYLTTALELVESLTSPTIGATIVGEGNETLFPNPLKAQLQLVISAVKVIQRGVGTFRANLDICRDQRRQLEFQVAQCIELVDFVRPVKRDEVYRLVVDIVDKAEEEGVAVNQARNSISQAESHRENERWKPAYRSLCDAYQKIGVTGGGGSPPRPPGGGPPS